jgi:23S rRNA (pseudouridine1915-N3)-methyltransferase
MNIRLLTAGKTTDAYLKTGINEYVARLKHYAAFEIQELQNKKAASRDDMLKGEANKFLSVIKANDYVILLDENGEQLTSAEFAAKIAWMQSRSITNVVFLVGGAFGFHADIIKRADYKMSLSKMTFTHQMIRLFFAEQLYRAFSILKNEKYHH